MKVLLVSDYGHLAGGAELMMMRLREELRRRGHDARFFSTALKDKKDQNFADYTCFGTESGFRTLLQTANPWAYRGLSTVLTTFRPDVVHVRLFLTQLSPLILPLLKHVPSIYHVAWYRPICPKGTKVLPDGQSCQSRPGHVCLKNGCLPVRDWAPLMLQMRMLTAWRHHFDLVVANSRAVKARLEAEDISPVEVVYNGIPIEPMPARTLDTPTVAFVGRLVREKGTHVLIEAFEQVTRHLPEAQLLIVGDGPERGALADNVQARGLSHNVQFLGHLSHDAMAQSLKPARVHVVPSLWAEPFGIVAVEAMMRGLPVIASAHGGLQEIVDDGSTGLLVPPGNSDRLAEALLQILSHQETSERMGAAGYARAVEKFSLKTFCDRFVSYYEGLTQRSRP